MTKSYEELLTDMTEIIAKIHDKGYEKGYQQGKFDEKMESGLRGIAKVTQDAGYSICETAQEKRDRIVEQAKKDIADLKERMISGKPNYVGNSTFRARTTVVDFVVNKEKRTVVAIVKGHHVPTIYEKGIAKCAPNDCFNVFIGEAIALRRALGLGVPDEYYTAPQPTDVRIGDVVSGNDERGHYAKTRHFTITGISTEAPTVYKKAYAYKEDNSDWIYEDQIGVIIDDSREGGR